MLIVEAKGILEHCFNEMLPGDLLAKARKKYAQLPVRTAQDEMPANGMTLDAVKARIGELGPAVEDTDSAFALLVPAGHKDRNHAIIEVSIHEDRLIVAAWAKEGLIPQKTTQKAIEKIFALLRQ